MGGRIATMSYHDEEIKAIRKELHDRIYIKQNMKNKNNDFLKNDPLEISTKKAMDLIIMKLLTDSDYRMSWKANIAMAFQDEYAFAEGRGEKIDIHKISNEAAEQFLHVLTTASSYQGEGYIDAVQDPDDNEDMTEHFINLINF